MSDKLVVTNLLDARVRVTMGAEDESVDRMVQQQQLGRGGLIMGAWTYLGMFGSGGTPEDQILVERAVRRLVDPTA